MSRSPALLLASVVAALALAACHGPCRQLSERLCDCATSTTEKTTCLTRASNEESRLAPTAEDEATCAALLETCDCHLIATTEGKKRCGLAR